MSDIKINRVNRSLGIKVHLYFNSSSYNRQTDSLPRFYIQPVELLTLDKAAFSSASKSSGYVKYGNRFWKHKNDETLTEAQAESLYASVKDSYPYGYIQNDKPSFLKYWYDVHHNEDFQSFYKTYWEDHEDEVKQPINRFDGTKDYPFPYIEFTVNELVTNKYTVGTVPTLPSGLHQAADYEEGKTYYGEPANWSCMYTEIDVDVSKNGEYFYMENMPKYLLKLNATGRYKFNLKNDYNRWPTGESGVNSGYRLKFSTGEDGTWASHNEYTSGISYVLSPETAYYHMNVVTKTAAHPQHGNGSVNGYSLSGSGGTATGVEAYTEGTGITLRRESTYYFLQYSGSNSGHPLYISTDVSGAATDNAYTSGVRYSIVNYSTNVGSGKQYMRFEVPLAAPDTLYYACKNHSYMGGQINIVDSPTAPKTGSIPGETVVVTLSATGDTLLHYYSPEMERMGNKVMVKTGCGNNDLFGPSANIDLYYPFE